VEGGEQQEIRMSWWRTVSVWKFLRVPRYSFYGCQRMYVESDHDQNCERTECQGESTPTPEVDTKPLLIGKTYCHVSVGRFAISWVKFGSFSGSFLFGLSTSWSTFLA
jgi:hypothetical protein